MKRRARLFYAYAHPMPGSGRQLKSSDSSCSTLTHVDIERLLNVPHVVVDTKYKSISELFPPGFPAN